MYSNLCEADALGESSGAGPLNTGCLPYIGFGRDRHMRSQKFPFTLNKGNKFGNLATDLLKEGVWLLWCPVDIAGLKIMAGK